MDIDNIELTGEGYRKLACKADTDGKTNFLGVLVGTPIELAPPVLLYFRRGASWESVDSDEVPEAPRERIRRAIQGGKKGKIDEYDGEELSDLIGAAEICIEGCSIETD
jgi:hypothetical protein